MIIYIKNKICKVSMLLVLLFGKTIRVTSLEKEKIIYAKNTHFYEFIQRVNELTLVSHLYLCP